MPIDYSKWDKLVVDLSDDEIETEERRTPPQRSYPPAETTCTGTDAGPSAQQIDHHKMKDPAQMRTTEIRKELESYGVKTSFFLEKSEIVNALRMARESIQGSKQSNHHPGERKYEGNREKILFQEWMQKVNGGKKTTLEQQFQLTMDLYQQAYPDSDQQQTANQVIEIVKNTPIHDTNSIVSWTGIKVDWFLNVFCKSPFMKVLIDYGCEVWFIRKICVIEMVRQTSASKSQEQPNGTFVENIHSVINRWGLEGSQDITCKPTTFVSYTGAYTMEHVVQVLASLDPQEYIWMDIFCVNQFAWTGKGRTPEMKKFRNTFMDDLQNQIQAIGNTALILEKWDNVMLTLGQMWVLWEIFNTAQAKVNLNVLLTPEQRESFVSTCLQNVESNKEFENMQASLARIDANAAVTEDDIDRKFILERMQREDKNLGNVNTVVLEVMRNWLCEEGMEHLSKIRAKGETPTLALLSHLGLLMKAQGKLDDAEQLQIQALERSQELLSKIKAHRDASTSALLGHTGMLLRSQGRLNESGKALELSQLVLDGQHKSSPTCINNLGMVLLAKGKLNEAEPLLREALEFKRQVLGDQHPDTIISINNMGLLLKSQGRLDQAKPLYEEALKLCRTTLGDHDPQTIKTISNLGLLLLDQNNLYEAEPLLKEALEASRKLRGKRHPDTLMFISNLGILLKLQGRLKDAEPFYREALKTRRQVLGDKHQQTLDSINNLGLFLFAQDRMDEAEPLLREGMAISKKVLGDKHPDTLSSIQHLAVALMAQGKLDEAEPLMFEAYLLDSNPT